MARGHLLPLPDDATEIGKHRCTARLPRGKDVDIQMFVVPDLTHCAGWRSRPGQIFRYGGSNGTGSPPRHGSTHLKQSTLGALPR